MNTICIIRLDNYKSGIRPEYLFGDETKKVAKLCHKIMDNKLNGHQIEHPAHEYCRQMGISLMGLINIGVKPADFIRDYADENPDEMAKYSAEIAEWNAANLKLFRTLYGIAKTHHIRVEWCGKGNPCEPDRFIVTKSGVRYLIQC